MPRYTKCILVGNVCKEPKVSQAKNGKDNATFTLALDRGTKENPKTIFQFVRVWGYAVKTVEDLVHAGDCVLVEGEMDKEEWKDDSGGKKEVVIIAPNKVECLNNSRGGASGRRDPDDRCERKEQRRPQREPGEDDVPF